MEMDRVSYRGIMSEKEVRKKYIKGDALDSAVSQCCSFCGKPNAVEVPPGVFMCEQCFEEQIVDEGGD